MGCESLVILSGKVGEKEYKKLYPPYAKRMGKIPC